MGSQEGQYRGFIRSTGGVASSRELVLEALGAPAGGVQEPILGVALAVDEFGSHLVTDLDMRLVALGCADRGDFAVGVIGAIRRYLVRRAVR